MCGIIGCVSNNRLDRSLVDKLQVIQFHRGPDGHGQFFEKVSEFQWVNFLHQRLSIIDLSDGIQPMSDIHCKLTIVFNGEIFNHLELRKNLILKGHIFKTDHSDTEVILNMYREYGEDMLSKLNGMFSFVIYDKDRGLLFGARDRSGIKPLYYSQDAYGFYFSSEIKSLLLFGLDKKIDIQSLSNYLSFQFVPSPKTIYQGISKLQPAHYFIYNITEKKFTTREYWNIKFKHDKISHSTLKKSILTELEDSVKVWSESDVEVGVSLSGGLDSSAIVALYSKNSSRRIKTFSLGFASESNELDESAHARLVSNMYDTEHYEFILDASTLSNDIDLMVYHLDEPYGGGLPSWYIYKMMKGNVKVALTGTGGDELFGNYNKSLIYQNGFLNKIINFCRVGKGYYLDAFKNFHQAPNGFFYHHYMHGFEVQNLLIECNFSSPEIFLEKLICETTEVDFRNIVPYVDMKMQLPEEFLHVTDRFSMAHSIEARVPFLNPNMIDLVMSISPGQRMNYNDPKKLLRESIAHLLPHQILRTPKKGFTIPQDKWINSVLKDKFDYLLGCDYISKQGLFKFDSIKNMLNRKNFNKNMKIWTLFMFQLWYDKNMN